MPKQAYALVGNFGFAPGPKGMSVYAYDPATADMELVQETFDDVNVGHQSVDPERNVVYIINEVPSQRGRTGGGGYLMAVKIDPETGTLSLINERPSLSHEPCYTCLDKTGHYIIVAHHADFGFVTKIIKDDELYSTRTYFDDTGLVLFAINDDGSLGGVCDVVLTPADDASGVHTWSRHHSILADPSGELFIACDKGTEHFYSFRLDREYGRLIRLQETAVEPGLVPRYGVFHPTLPIFYANFEKKTLIRAYRYDVATGRLALETSAPLVLDETNLQGLPLVEPADIAMHPNCRHMYASIRGADIIAVLDIDEAGGLTLKQNISCGGTNPRGIVLSPDARFLLSANMNSANVTSFAIGEDGALSSTGKFVKARSPGNIKIIEL